MENNEEKEIVVEKKHKKSIFKGIMNLFLWVILLGWLGLCLIDYYNTYRGKDPMFCIKKETKHYEDGTVDSCLGVGYKIYNYKRSSLEGLEYGPFWLKERSNIEEEESK